MSSSKGNVLNKRVICGRFSGQCYLAKSSPVFATIGEPARRADSNPEAEDLGGLGSCIYE